MMNYIQKAVDYLPVAGVSMLWQVLIMAISMVRILKVALRELKDASRGPMVIMLLKEH